MISNKFKLGLFFIVLLSLFLRLYIIRGNNLFFTVDQGRDAVYVREIITRGEIFTKGPETNIRGIFAGPLFYYFIAIGYLVTGGHPIGGALMMIALNLALIVLIIVWLRDKIGSTRTLLLGVALSFFWPFFETSLWSFNPFPLVILSFILVFLLVEFLKGYYQYYLYSLIPILLAFNAEVAGAAALFLFYFLVGIYGVRKKILPLKSFILIAVIPPIFGALILGRQFILGLISSRILGRAEVVFEGKSGGQVFAGTNFSTMISEFGKIIGAVAIPQNVYLGVLISAVVTAFLLIRWRVFAGSRLEKFICLVLFLTLVSFFFFSLNKGWRSWQTVYLPPLIFVSLLLMLTQIPKTLSILLFAVIMLFQTAHFRQKYLEYRETSNNPSLLYNELSTIDWIYAQSENQGFRVYNYTDTFYDYPYQYLFWWYGAKKYGYLPDEYSNFPRSHKNLYIPGYENYAQPARSGVGLKYLIIQSNKNGEENTDWPEKFKKYHELIDTTKVGEILIEKYKPVNNAPSDPCIWWGQCNQLEQNQIDRK